MRSIKDLAQRKVSATELSDLGKRPPVTSTSGHSSTADWTTGANVDPIQAARIRRGNDAHDRYERDASFYMTPAKLANDMLEQSAINKLRFSTRFSTAALMAAVGLSLLVLATAAFF